MKNKYYAKIGLSGWMWRQPTLSCLQPKLVFMISHRLTMPRLEDAIWEVNTTLRYQSEQGKK